ncbi:Ig-like domain (group 3) [Pseudobutyrivibrio sp. YE44]|uniref:transglutaminase domain-containing protein n=1 Tax=Pseudobutyrivibrio sp. YE44 TaxID=1520802 RepID=UPI00088A13F3|nr:transglutaminase domain-containing protein [Pseudobutyrivibrio sp. YE44]SDB54959.1 Ig-like domain (group 3) [Pseudobutyrivibrio sp. YE44]
MKKKKRLIILLVVLLLIIGAGGIGTFAYYKAQSDLVYKEVIVEAGSSNCEIGEFLKREESTAKFTEDSSFDVTVPGDYDLKIQWTMPIFGKQTAKTVLHVQDTTAPQVTLTTDSIDMYTTAPAPNLTDLVDKIDDVTNCTIDFAEQYDFTKEGQFDITIVVKDTSGNETKCTVPCKVTEDVTPPVIKGVEPLTIAQGDAVSFKKNIEVTDDHDDNPTLEVDNSQVNVDKRGVYTLKYIATDAAGNKTEETTTVKIISAKIAAATEETVYAKADEILADIITPGMTQLQQAKAVFDWVVKNITYSETAGIDDLLSAAYKGMFNRVGDCTVKQKTAEVMLNRLGIKNMEIEKIRDTRGHYWLLIDVGEGWYHYDPNLQLDGTLIFYWHDADLWEYSNAHKNTHNYDPSKYPHIQ